MNYIKKKDIKDLLSNKLCSFFEKKGFKLIRSDNRLVKEVIGGAFYIDYNVLDSYNTEKDEVAWRIEVVYFVRFNAVHNWVEPFEHRKKKDYKYSWTVGKNLNEINNTIFEIDVDEYNIENKLENILQNVISAFIIFFNENKSLTDIAKSLMPNEINSIEDIKKIKNFNVNTAIKYIAIAWILKRSDFDSIVSVSKIKLKQLFEVGDPMAIFYMPKLDEMISTLKRTDFSNAPLTLGDIQ